MNKLLRKEVLALLNDESQKTPNWDDIATRSLELIRRSSEGEFDIPNEVHQYLDDVDIRPRDARYAAWQRQKVREFILKTPEE